MAEWSEAQVLEWAAIIDLPPGCAETVGLVFQKMELDGDDLARVHGKQLAKRLAKRGLEVPQLAVQTLLCARDSVLAGSGQKQRGDGVPAVLRAIPRRREREACAAQPAVRPQRMPGLLRSHAPAHQCRRQREAAGVPGVPGGDGCAERAGGAPAEELCAAEVDESGK